MSKTNVIENRLANKKAALLERAKGRMVKAGEDVDVNRPFITDFLQSTDVDEIWAFLKGNCTTYEFSIQYGVTNDGRVFEFFKKGRMGKRNIKKMMAEHNIVEWHFSWAWAAKNWYIPHLDKFTRAVKIDLSPAATLETAVSILGG